MTKVPKKRDPKANPIQGNPWVMPRTPNAEPPPSEKRIPDGKGTRFSTCSRCMGFGGMDGGCPKCGGTGFID